MPSVTFREITSRKSEICREILNDLPEWFGIPEAVDAYVRAVEGLRMIACVAEEAPVGFLALKIHNSFTAEAYVLGVKRAWHRKGIGRSLFQYAEDILREMAFVYLTVKTVAADRPNTPYAVTQRFYEALDFLPLEIFPTLWSAENPCLLMVKSLNGVASMRARQAGAITP